MVIKHKPFINIGTGDIIKDELEVLNWTQEDLANIMGMSKKGINEIITNKSTITIETAKLLSKSLGPSPQFWINADTNYRLRLNKEAKKERESALKAEIYKHMPVREMIKKGWLLDYKKIADLENGVKKFWNTNRIDFSFMEKVELPIFRKSNAYYQYNTYYALCWYEMAKKCAKKYSVSKYMKENLYNLSQNISEFTVKENGIEDFLNKLNNVGIKFFMLSHLPKTYLDGASFYDNGNPVIVYSGRYNRTDNFWFTIAHEIAHILMHLKKGDCFLDNLESLETKVEKEADSLSSEMLNVKKILEYFKHRMRYISETQVRQCAEQLTIDPAIVVGALQYYGELSRKNLNRFKKPVMDLIPEKYFVEKKL
jgi:HTH-type transcriptional regulator/antitoxin HigA